MPDELEIPAAALETKAWFHQRPGPEIVREIREFIKRTGEPHLWRGHTHTQPPRGARVFYLGEYDVPKLRGAQVFAPCPCCRPRTPWYFRAGKIAWFPDEGVIRNIGPDCFATLNPEGHTEAVRQLRIEERRTSQINYLLAHLGDVPEIIRVIEAAIPIVDAVDQVRRILRDNLNGVLNTKVWQHVRDGSLKVEVGRTESFQRADGSSGERNVTDFQVYGPLAGHIMLDPTSKPLAPTLQRARAQLRGIDFGADFAAKVPTMSDPEREKVARTLNQWRNKVGEVLAEAEEARRLLSPTGIGSLVGWSKHPGCPIKIYITRDGNNVCIGQSEHQLRRLVIPSEFWDTFGTLPRKAETPLAAE
jgi:hypothetical protein